MLAVLFSFLLKDLKKQALSVAFFQFGCTHTLCLSTYPKYVYFIVTGRCHKKVPFPPLTIGPADVSSPPLETYSTLCNWHWNSSSIRILLSIQQHSNYVLFISEQWASTAWYGSGVCDTFLITEWVYPDRTLPLVHHLLNEIELELCILGLYYSIDSSST